MDLLYETHLILEQAGFHVEQSIPGEACDFEDQGLYGFVRIYASVNDLLSNWEKHQDSFLERHARHIRASPEKAWNAYSVFLTSADAARDHDELLRIEEDFRGTRKIARATIVTIEELKRALQPVLPIDTKIEPAPAVGPKLEERLTFLQPDEIGALVNQDVHHIIAALAIEEQ
jgi:hypothetical protein